MTTPPVNLPPESRADSPTQSPTEALADSPQARPIESEAMQSRRVDVFGRLECYMLAAMCATVIWVGLQAPAGGWQKWAELFVGMTGLVALCVCIVHWRLE